MLQVDDLPFLLEPLKDKSGCDKPKKCAVIDLDETLVHSSFAVSVCMIMSLAVVVYSRKLDTQSTY